MPRPQRGRASDVAQQRECTAMAIGVCALKGQDRKARGALSTPGRRSQVGSCTPTGYDRQPRGRALSPSAGDRTSLLDHAAPREACDRTPLGYKTYLAPSTRGAQRTPGFAILPFQGTNTERYGRAPAVRCATSEALPCRGHSIRSTRGQCPRWSAVPVRDHSGQTEWPLQGHEQDALPVNPGPWQPLARADRTRPFRPTEQLGGV